jgi:hypothetical protein
MQVLNPLTNTDIIGFVNYYKVEQFVSKTAYSKDYIDVDIEDGPGTGYTIPKNFQARRRSTNATSYNWTSRCQVAMISIEEDLAGDKISKLDGSTILKHPSEARIQETFEMLPVAIKEVTEDSQRKIICQSVPNISPAIKTKSHYISDFHINIPPVNPNSDRILQFQLPAVNGKRNPTLIDVQISNCKSKSQIIPKGSVTRFGIAVNSDSSVNSISDNYRNFSYANVSQKGLTVEAWANSLVKKGCLTELKAKNEDNDTKMHPGQANDSKFKTFMISLRCLTNKPAGKYFYDQSY